MFVKKDNWVIEVADEEVEKYLNPVQDGDEKWELATQEEFDAREEQPAVVVSDEVAAEVAADEKVDEAIAELIEEKVDGVIEVTEAEVMAEEVKEAE